MTAGEQFQYQCIKGRCTGDCRPIYLFPVIYLLYFHPHSNIISSSNYCFTNLGQHDGDDGLGVHEGGVAEVVQAARGQDLGAGLPPDGLLEGHASAQQLGRHAAERAQHRPPSVDDLDCAVPIARI